MLSATDLYSLEEYSRIRPQFKADVVSHKKQRQVALGDHITLTFEDRKTIQYQIQEMLRIERTFEAQGIQDELDAYAPLIPTGTNLKASMFIEYGDPEERKIELKKLAGIEHRVYIQVAGYDPVYALADEDLERGNDDKTSAVHFLTFDFTRSMIESIKSGKRVVLGVDHKYYESSIDIQGSLRESLEKDFLTFV